MEELGDISYHIFIRLKDKDIAALLLASPAMVAVYDKLDKSQLFWRAKVEQALIEEEDIPWSIFYTLPGDRRIQHTPDVDWKFVYRNIKTRQAVILNDAPITSVNTLRVLIEHLGMTLRIRHHSEELLANSGVLNYLIDNAEEIGMPDHSLGYIMKHIARDNPASVTEAALIDVLKNPMASQSIKNECTSALIEEGVTDKLVEITKKYAPGILESRYMLQMAIWNGGPSLKFVFSVSEFSTSMILEAIDFTMKIRMSKIEDLLKYAHEHFSLEVLSSMLLRHWNDREMFESFRSAQFSSSEWRFVLEEAMRADIAKVVLLCLENVSPNIQDVLDALNGHSYNTLRVLLSDERIDVNSNIRSLLLAANHKIGVRALTSSPRLNIDSLDSPSLEIVAEAFDLKYVTGYPSYKFYEPDTVYWFIARYLFLKEPTEIQLLGYIGDALLYTDEVKQALASVLDERADYSSEAAPIRALLLFLMYPNMYITESEMYLRDVDNYSNELIDSSNFLIRMVEKTTM